MVSAGHDEDSTTSLNHSQDPQREQLQALLDNIYGDFVSTVAKARGKTEADVEAMLDDGIYGADSLLLSVLQLDLSGRIATRGYISVCTLRKAVIPGSHAQGLDRSRVAGNAENTWNLHRAVNRC